MCKLSLSLLALALALPAGAATKTRYRMIEGAPVNVLDFGAKGDGVADDTAAIQLALNAGTHVVIPAGHYLVTPPLLVPSHRVVRGAGMGVTVLTVKAGGSYPVDSQGYRPGVFRNSDVTNGNVDIEFSDLSIDGNKAGLAAADGGTPGSAGAVSGIVIRGSSSSLKASNVRIRNVEVVNIRHNETPGVGAYGFGIIVAWIDLVHISRCYLHHNEGDGVDLFTGTSRATIENSRFDANIYLAIESEGRVGALDWTTGRNAEIAIVGNQIANSPAAGISVLGTDVFTIANNVVVSGGVDPNRNRRGIQALGSAAGTITGNAVDSYGDAVSGGGIMVGNDYYNYPDIYGSIASNRAITVSGNSVSNCGRGIWIWQGTSSPAGRGTGINDAISVTGNTVRGSALYGISVEGSVNRVTVARNSTFGGQDGVYVTDLNVVGGSPGSGPVVVSDNTIDTPSRYGITVMGQVGARVLSNTIRGTGDVAIVLDPGTTGLSGVEVSRNQVSATGGTRSIDASAVHTNLTMFENITDKRIGITPAAGDRMRGNTGYVTAASGVTAAIATGATVTHGLGSTAAGLAPTVVTLQAADGTPTAIFPSALGTTTFTVNFTGAGTHVFHWTARAAQDQ